MIPCGLTCIIPNSVEWLRVVGRIVQAGLVQDMSGLVFEKRFKGSKHPFDKSVYRKAATIDQHMADNMDTCRIK